MADRLYPELMGPIFMSGLAQCKPGGRVGAAK